MDTQEHYPTIPKRYGLQNMLGNTDPVSSAFQIFKNIPQLNNLIRTFQPTNGHKNSAKVNQQTMVDGLKRIFRFLENQVVNLQFLVNQFWQTHPKIFRKKTWHECDKFMQQFLNIMSESNVDIAKGIQSLFQIQFVDVTKNLQIQEEPKREITYSRKLSCSVAQEKYFKINTLNECIRLNLETELQKISVVDKLNHKYKKTTRFNTLPPYLHVQIIRFIQKKAFGQLTAVYKKIRFNQVIDIFDYCLEELKNKLLVGRDVMKENKQINKQQYKKKNENINKFFQQNQIPQEWRVQFEEMWDRQHQPLATGYYQLIGIVSHRGESEQNGHYMAWLKQKEFEWTKYDDDKVYRKQSSQVESLQGGQPNSEKAYVLLFRNVYAKPL